MVQKKDIIEKASKCLNCKISRCSIKGCPINTKIPDFIKLIKEDNLEEEYKILKENNFMSYICSIVCPQEKQCEGSCVRGLNGTPVEIGFLEKYVNEWAIENNYKYSPEKESNSENTKKNIAIIGSGPAGLECAYQLRLKNYNVDIFEKENAPGGVLTYGIPDFRLNKEIINNVVRELQNMGINFKLNCSIGNSQNDKYTLEILKQQYDAVCIAVGIGKSITYKIAEDETLLNKQIYDASTFLNLYAKNGLKEKKLGNVIVIGGGNVALDCSRVAKKLGAKTCKIFYRRDITHMPGNKKELEEAISEKIEFCENIRVIDGNIENGKLVSINCIRTKILDEKAVDLENTEFIEPCDTVIMAIGQRSDSDLLNSQGLILDNKNNIVINENYQTNFNNVFAAGDVTGEIITVCNAIKSGRNASKAIDCFLSQI